MFLFSLKKKKFIVFMLMAGLLLLWINFSTAAEMPTPVINSLPPVVIKGGENLLSDSEEAREKNIPILIFFSMQHCPYCIEVEEDFLKPMLRSGDYKNKVIIRKIQLESTNLVRDFKGLKRDAEEFSDDYNVAMVPTLVLVNSYGNTIMPPIIGILNSHYYGGELDDAIDASLKKLKNNYQRHSNLIK